MSRERDLLEAFYFREEPLAVALVDRDYTVRISLGFSLERYLGHLGSTDGMSQVHLESRGVTIFAARLEGGDTLVVLHPFVEDLEVTRPWLRFVHLATHITLCLEPSPPEDLPSAGFAVKRPLPSGPPAWPRSLHASPEADDNGEPA
jgi:hypothetical protein